MRARRRLPRWGVTLLALPGLLGSAVVGANVVPWSFVYGSSADEGHDLDGIAFFGWALLIGLGAWVLCWIALAAPARALWAAAVVVALLAPAVAMNVQTFTAARRDVCEIRGGQRQGASDLHDVPWPLTVDCRP